MKPYIEILANFVFTNKNESLNLGKVLISFFLYQKNEFLWSKFLKYSFAKQKTNLAIRNFFINFFELFREIKINFKKNRVLIDLKFLNKAFHKIIQFCLKSTNFNNLFDLVKTVMILTYIY